MSRSPLAYALVGAGPLGLVAARNLESCWSTDFHLGLTGVPPVIHEY